MAGKPPAENTVVLQWDPSITAFASTDRIRSLVAATSQDDVQVTAVLAMERIGAYLIVSGPLYSHAIDALGGNRSIRFAHAKLLVGLSGGGVASQLRHSSAGVRTFLLVAALKGCMYNDREIGQILYDFMDVQDILHHQAASIRQLQSVVGVLSSNCEHLLPSIIETHQEVVRKLTYEAKEDWTGQYFGVFECKEMATLLVRAFGAIQDRSIDYIEMTGVIGLVWLASLLLWINQEEVGLFCWSQHLMGAENGKVRIEIDSTAGDIAAEDASWKVKTWRSGKWTEFVVPAVELLERFNRRRSQQRLPRKLVRSFFLERDVDDLDHKNAIIGGVAAGLVDAALKYGRVGKVRPENTIDRRSQSSSSIHRVVKYSALCPESGQHRGGTILQDFGWDRESIVDHQNSLINFVSDQSSEITEDSLRRFLRKEHPELDEGQEIDIMASASKVAVHAITALHQEYGSCEPFYCHDHESRWLWDLWSQDMNLLLLNTLREKCYQFSGFEHDPLAPGYNALMLASNGRVAYPQVCVDHSTNKSGLLELRIVAGHIRFGNSGYSGVIEQRGDRHCVPPKTAHGHWSTHIIDEKTRTFLLDPSPERYISSDGIKGDHKSSSEYHFAADETCLLMRTYLSSPASGKRDVNYRETAEELAFANHVKPSKIPLNPSIVVEDLIEKDLLQVAVKPCGQPGVINNSRRNPRFVTMLPSCGESRFFEAHPQFMPIGVEDLYIQQGASLANCMRETFLTGKPKGGSWKIITGSDW